MADNRIKRIVTGITDTGPILDTPKLVGAIPKKRKLMKGMAAADKKRVKSPAFFRSLGL